MNNWNGNGGFPSNPGFQGFPQGFPSNQNPAPNQPGGFGHPQGFPLPQNPTPVSPFMQPPPGQFQNPQFPQGFPSNQNPQFSIFARIAATPNILNATGQRLNDGHFLVRILGTKYETGKKSGECYVIEFEVIDGTEYNPDGTPKGKTTMRGARCSSVPKVKNTEVTVRELAEFISAIEGKENGFQSYVNPATGQVNAEALNFDIARTFHNRDPQGTPMNPYQGAKVFVVASKQQAVNSKFEFVKHNWFRATETLARQYGYEWGDGPRATPMSAQAAPQPFVPLPQNPAPVPIPALGSPLPGVPVPPPAPAPVPMPAPAPAPVQGFPPGFMIPPGWEPSPQFAGWLQSPVGGNPVRFWNPATNEVTDG